MDTITLAGRNRNARKLAARYLTRLREATEHIAPATAPGWHSDFALGFMAGHVSVGMYAAAAHDMMSWFRKSWPSPEDILALGQDLIPEQMGFEPLAFRAAFDRATKRWPRGSAMVTPTVEGVLLAERIVRITHAASYMRPQMDDWTKRVDDIEKEFSRLPGRNPAIRLVWRAPANLYRYLVLRTLGVTTFGISVEQAGRFSLEH